MPLIKRYANRKLYDTESGQYVTLEDLAGYIRRGEDVRVVDHATGSDLTSVTLLQVLFREEKKLGELLPQVVLTRLIRTGGDTLETLRTRLLAAFDPQGHVEEEIRHRVNELAARGEISPADAARMLEKLLGHTLPPAEQGPPQELDEYAAMLQQVEALENELRQMQSKV
jgi:polyhydroxyalkanoate synthesis repressor PhaR